MNERSIWVGYDPREDDAYQVAKRSIQINTRSPIPIRPILLHEMRQRGLYWRHHDRRLNNQLWDIVSDAPMSTEFAISRFLTPNLADMHGWALFMDCDFMARYDVAVLFENADDRYAVMVVKHPTRIFPGTKMDGQAQTRYPCKNWSSLMLFNCRHPSNLKLTPHLISTVPGRDLHRFCWLEPHEIGELDSDWNHLVGLDPPNPFARMAHFTLGIPRMNGYQDSEFADEWFGYLSRCAA